MSKKVWRDRLTPYDVGLCKMVSHLTEKECKPKNGGTHYFIEVDYSDIPNPDYISGVLAAIRGRIGDRFISMTDDTDSKRVIVRIGYSKSVYPMVVRSENCNPANEGKGRIYCRKLGEVKAMQVLWEDFDRLVEFVGNGEMEIGEDGSTFIFLNRGSVYEFAREGDYIIMLGEGQFQVMGRKEFESEYDRK